jgi:hypothetical protein
MPDDSRRDRWRDALSDKAARRAAEEEPDRAGQQRNVGVAVAVLALVVVALLLAIVTGATDAFRP